MKNFDEVMRTFLDEQPQWLVEDVKYVTRLGGDEPSISLSVDAMRAFVVWLKEKGMFSNPESVPGFLAALDEQRGSDPDTEDHAHD